MTEMQYLRQVTEEGARRRYGDRPADAEDLSLRARAWTTIDHELAFIEQLDFAGYFLIVWDIVEFCRRSNIFCQGRGAPRTRRSATRSASPPPMRCRSGCCSSGSCRPSVTARPTSTSTSKATGARR